MGKYGMFPFLIILGTVPGCNLSVRAYGFLQVGHLMSQFAISSSVVSVGPFALIKYPLFKFAA